MKHIALAVWDQLPIISNFAVSQHDTASLGAPARRQAQKSLESKKLSGRGKFLGCRTRK